jgi:hypothetical protein
MAASFLGLDALLSKFSSFLSSLSYITLLSLININVPGIAKDINSALMNLA